ncbi:MAG: HYR domain-containing protein [Phycisphaerales bacterium]|nr:HYR domain-containing protein [Phycisphaerales bacterium]
MSRLFARMVAVGAMLAAWTSLAAPPRSATPFGEEQLPGAPGLRHQDDGTGEGMIASFGPGMGAGANHIISMQCPNGGWNWEHGGCGATYNNITGPICRGLLNVYDHTGDLAALNAAIDGGDYDLTFVYGNGEYRLSSFTPAFFRTLTGATGDTTYSDHAATEFFDELTAATYGPSNLDTAGWIAAVQSARSGSQINLRPWDFHNLPWVAGEIGNAGQQDAFRDAVLAGLGTLDRTSPGSVYWDLIGLAGGVRGLALNATTSFPALVAPNFLPINGLTDLCDLTAVLVSYQNGDGSWYWSSNLGAPVEADKDTQTTAYAVMALMAADVYCTEYSAQIELGRDWLRSMQFSGGGFEGWPGGGSGSENVEVEGEALSALAPGGQLNITPTDPCDETGTIVFEIKMSDLTETVVGGQFFLSYDDAVLDFVSADPGDAPFTFEFYEVVDEGMGTIDYAVNIPIGGSGTSSDTVMARLTFNALADTCSTPALISFRAHTPPSRLSNEYGGAVAADLNDASALTIDRTAPALTCPDPFTAGCGVSTDPPASGTATALDACDATPTITFDDNRSGLTGCNATGTIARTWRAVDDCGNVSTCVQTITVVDTEAPVMTPCPSDISVNADAGLCTAVVTYTPPTATDQCYFEGFEDAYFTSGLPLVDGVGTPSVNWNDYNSHLARVLSGTDGIASASGAAHGRIDSTTLPPPPDDWTGAFTRLRGYSPVFGTGFRTSLDVYIDLTDPAVAAKTYGWDLGTAANNQSNAHRRDFIFHAAADNDTNPGAVLIAASNNSGFVKRNDLETINHYVISTSGWYTFQWVLRDFGDGTLAVDCNLRDSGGVLLWTETRNDASDIIATVVGGNRYMWFTFLAVDKLAIDNTRLIRNVPVVSAPPSGSTFSAGTTPVSCTATDACGNVASCGFEVFVDDVNDLKVKIELSPTMDAAVTRCITFELWDCPNPTPTIVEAEIPFNGVGYADTTIEVPCGVYDCVTARDALHTLRRTADDFTDAGTVYTATFTGDVDSGGDWLVGGNLNDDPYIDILDFGVFVWQYADVYGTGDTTCSTPYPHADVTGDGIVWTEDWLFIFVNFLDSHEGNCCGFGPGDGDGHRNKAVRSITVEKLKRRGMAQLAAGDLNGDGVLDEADMIAFQNGARPKRPETGGGGNAQDPGSVEGQDRP